MIKKIITYTLYIVSGVSILLASGIKQVANWWDIAKPFFAVWFIALSIALILSNVSKIRRITYPVFVCLSAWSYKHKIIMTKFTRDTHRLYKFKNSSYRKLFEYTQNLFDLCMDAD